MSPKLQILFGKWILTCFPGDHRLGSLKDDAVELGGSEPHQNVVGVKGLMLFCRGGAFHPLMSTHKATFSLFGTRVAV